MVRVHDTGGGGGASRQLAPAGARTPTLRTSELALLMSPHHHHHHPSPTPSTPSPPPPFWGTNPASNMAACFHSPQKNPMSNIRPARGCWGRAATCASNTHTHATLPPDLHFYFVFFYFSSPCLFSGLHALFGSARPVTDTCQQRHRPAT